MLLRRYKEHRAIVPDIQEEVQNIQLEESKEEETQVEIPNYKSMKKAELEDLLTSLGIEYAADSTNAQKVDLLDAYYMNKG